MKNLIIIIVLNFICGSIIAQVYGYHEETNLETNTGMIKFDTSIPNNIWQIGEPQKVIFDEAYSVPNAIMTDLNNPYPVNNTSSFYLSIKEVQWFTGSPSTLRFYHKFDTDSLTDGGYIDVSYDGGASWLNIIYDSTMFNCSWTPGFWYFSSNFYGDSDTLFNGMNGFSGKSDDWQESMFIWFYCLGVDEEYPDSMMIRFNFISDDLPSDKEGWMIDNIVLHSDLCGFTPEGKTNDYSVTIQPNPINNESRIIIHGTIKTKYNLTITDIFGRQVYTITASDNEFLLNNTGLKTGIYFYRIKFEDNIELTGKILKN
jgi:hypothetical protein